MCAGKLLKGTILPWISKALPRRGHRYNNDDKPLTNQLNAGSIAMRTLATQLIKHLNVDKEVDEMLLRLSVHLHNADGSVKSVNELTEEIGNALTVVLRKLLDVK